MNSDDLIKFLTDRIDEDEVLARQAEETGSAPKWDPAADAFLMASLRTRARLAAEGVERALDGAVEAHAARHDPARALAEAASKRRILARHSPAPGGEELAMPPYCAAHAFRHFDGTVTYPVQMSDCLEVRDLAAAYAWHPAYRVEWKP